VRHPLRRIAVQGAWYAAGTSLVKLSGFLLLPVLTNPAYLSVADYGRWGVLETTVQIAVVVLGLSLAAGLVRFYHEPGGGAAVVSASWWMSAAMAAALLLVGWPAAGALAPPAARLLYRWLLLFTAFEILYAIPTAALRAQERAGLHTAWQALKLVLLLTFTLWFLVGRGLALPGYILALALSSGIATAGAVVAAGRRELLGRFDRGAAARVLRFSTPLVLGALGSIVLNAGARYVLVMLRTPEELAHYALASRMGGVVNLVAVQPLNLAWMPLLFRLREDQRPEVLRILVPYLVIGFSGIVILISAGAAPLLALMGSDPSYARGVPLIPWIGFGYAAFGLVVVTTGLLALHGRTAAISLWIVLAALANLALNFALVPRFGTMGSSVASLLAYGGLAAAQFRLARGLVPVRYPWGRIAGVALVSAAAAGAVALRRYTGTAGDWGLRFAVLVAWAGVLVAARWFTPREARDIWRVLRKRPE